MNTGNDTAETVIDNPEQVHGDYAETDMDLDDSPVHPTDPERQAYEQPLSISTADVFPMLAPAPEHWKVSLMELIEKLPETYLDNEDNLENCRRVPEWLDSAVQMISRVSGAILDVRAICPDSEDPDTVKCYTINTERLRPYRQNEEMAEEVAYFAHLVFGSFGPAMERRAPHVFPTVYSYASIRGRPLLCPMHPNPKQRLRTLIDFMMTYRRWQCGDTIDWDDASKEIGPFLEPQRYGEDVEWGDGPYHWDDETVRRCYLHAYTCQECILAGDTTAEAIAFQWILRAPGEPYVYGPWGSISELYTDENAAYSVSMARYNFPSHAYHPHIVCDPVCFTDSLVDSVRIQFNVPQSLVEVMKLAEINESMSPPVREASPKDPAILRLFSGVKFDLLERLISMDIPHGQQILFIIDYLKTALTRSIESDARPSIFPGTRDDRWSPKRLLHYQLGHNTPVEMRWPPMRREGKAIGASTTQQSSSEPAGTVVLARISNPTREKVQTNRTSPLPSQHLVLVAQPLISLASLEDLIVSPREPDMVIVDDESEADQYGILKRSKEPLHRFGSTLTSLSGRTVSGPPRASTGETRPTPLPRVPKENVSRRSQSLDPPTLAGTSGNALGLQVPLDPDVTRSFAPLSGPQPRADLSFEANLPSSTPHQKPKLSAARQPSGATSREVAGALPSETSRSRFDKPSLVLSEHFPTGKNASRSRSRDKMSASSRSPLMDSPVMTSLPDAGFRTSSTVGRRTPMTSSSQLPPETPVNQSEGKGNYLLQAAALVKRGRTTPGPSAVALPQH
ncbi:hypothetical protein RSOL_198000, partial [Rhizoctonia solani AG-3 Rhs1AP]